MRQLLNLRLCSSFSLPSASPILSFPLPLSALSLYAFSPSLFLSFSHQPQFPPSFILPLKLISCFLILSSPSELRITLGSLPSHSPPPVHCPSLHPLSRQLSFPPSFCFSPVSPFCPPSLHLPPPLCLLFTYRRHLESPNRQSQVKVIHQASPVLVGETGVQRPRSGLPENQSGLGRVCLTVQTTPPAPGTPFLPWDSYTMSPVSYKPPLSFQLLAGRGAWNV